MKSKNSIEEIWRIREEIGAEHGYDMDRLVRVVPRHTPETAHVRPARGTAQG